MLSTVISGYLTNIYQLQRNLKKHCELFIAKSGDKFSVKFKAIFQHFSQILRNTTINLSQESRSASKVSKEVHSENVVRFNDTLNLHVPKKYWNIKELLSSREMP